jgi:hypothetical protein
MLHLRVERGSHNNYSETTGMLLTLLGTLMASISNDNVLRKYYLRLLPSGFCSN